MSPEKSEEMKVKKQRSVTAGRGRGRGERRRFSGGAASLPGTNSA